MIGYKSKSLLGTLRPLVPQTCASATPSPLARLRKRLQRARAYRLRGLPRWPLLQPSFRREEKRSPGGAVLGRTATTAIAAVAGTGARRRLSFVELTGYPQRRRHTLKLFVCGRRWRGKRTSCWVRGGKGRRSAEENAAALRVGEGGIVPRRQVE